MSPTHHAIASLAQSTLAAPVRIDLTEHEPQPLAQPRWGIDPGLTFLNHGSYGAMLRPVAQVQAAYRERMERDPVRFFKSDLEPLLDGVRERLGAFLNCRPVDLALAPNATYALCVILANTPLGTGDEVLITDHEYSSLTNELERVTARTGCRVVTTPLPFPITSPGMVAERFLSRVTPRTRLAIISHVTSATSLVFPVAEVVRELNARGIDCVVDGAHSPGQIPVDVRALNPAYFIGSGHKWLSAPKGSGFLFVRADKQAGFRSLALSSRANKVRPDRALFLRDFDYMGTGDYTPLLAMPQAVESMGSLLPGGWPALLRHNHGLIVKGREIVAKALGLDAPAPETMVGTMATLPLPEPSPEFAARPTRYDDPLQDALLERHGVVVPIWRWGPSNLRVVRLSAQLYNTPAQYEKLAGALVEELALERAYRVSA